MTSQAFLQALKQDVDIFAHASLDTPLNSLTGWDSLATLLVIAHFEDKYGVAVSGLQVRACVTVRDLLALLPPSQP